MGMPSTRETPTLSFVGTIVSAADRAKDANGGWRSVEVRVNEVVQSPPALPDIKGATVTVHLAESETADPGPDIFFGSWVSHMANISSYAPSMSYPTTARPARRHVSRRRVPCSSIRSEQPRRSCRDKSFVVKRRRQAIG